MKTCTKCGKTHPKSEFYFHKNTKDNLASLCKYCYRENEKNWKSNNQEAYKESCRRRNLKKKFGITTEDYENLYALQNGSCACCGEKKPNRSIEGLVVDHCHKTGKVRQLLCNACNTALGLLKENEDTIQNLLKYVRKHNG